MRNLALIIIVAAAACGGDDKKSDAPVMTGLAVMPATVALVKDSNASPTQAFTAAAVFDDGHQEDITSQVTWSIDNGIVGAMLGPQLSITGVGLATVTASLSGTTATASVTSTTNQTVLDPGSGLTDDAKNKFGGAASAAFAPSIVYPTENVLLPPNFQEIDVHFRPAAGGATTLYLVRFTGQYSTVSVVTRCVTAVADGCVFSAINYVSLLVGSNNAGLAPVAITVLATDDTGSAVGTSAPINVSFTSGSLQGVLYYDDRTDNTFKRVDFINARTTVDLKGTAGHCLGCHAVSHDGAKIVSRDNTNEQWSLYDVATNTASAPVSAAPTGWSAWASDDASFGVSYLVNTGNPVEMFDTNSVDLGALDVRMNITHIDFSHDGNTMVFAAPESYSGPQLSLFNASIMKASLSQLTVGTVATVFKDGNNAYFPSFSPDDSMILFNHSVCQPDMDASTCDGYNDDDAEVMVAMADINNDPVPLTNLNEGTVEDDPTTLANAYPRWCPHASANSNGGSVYWVTFASRRNYGLYTPNGKQIWMAAVEPSAIAAGRDGSFRAFFVPGQVVGDNNLLASWSE